MNKQETGYFIAFEGIDGSGKTTQAKILADRLRKRGNNVYLTSEPTEGPIGSLIHQHMTGRIHLNEETVAALFVADRLDHVLNNVNGLLDMINQSVIVITDRYYLSSYAYNSRLIPMEQVICMNSQCGEILRPDLNIFIDVSPEVCFRRLSESGRLLQRYEKIAELQEYYNNYILAMDALEDIEQIVTIEGDHSEHIVSDAIWSKICKGFNI